MAKQSPHQGIKLNNKNKNSLRYTALLWSWPIYFSLYFLTERFIPGSRCYTSYCALDNSIPFCEVFVIPYLLWYPLIAISLGYFLFYDAENFKRLQTYIMIVQFIATLIYILLPTKQELRPEFFQRDNTLTKLVAYIYRMDTNTGVCPSLHCTISLGIASVWLKKEDASKALKAAICILCTAICLSTLFIKQHSILDFLASIPLFLLGERLIYRQLFTISRPESPMP